jgi:putative ABC transport system substrate-binding protein
MQFDQLKRREFITLLGGAAPWPFAARAQQPGKLPTIGLLTAGAPATHGGWVNAFVQRLHELGWVDGRTLAIEYRWAEGRPERYAEIAAEFVRLKVDVIVTQGGAVAAAKKATSVIPIVFTVAADPLGAGLVASLSRPGGNVTGLSLQFTDLAGKRLELLHEAVSHLGRLAIMANAAYRAAALEMATVEATARRLGLEVVPSPIRRAEDVAPAIAALKGRADALYVCGDPLASTNQVQINTLALNARLPTMHGIGEYAKAGGLMSYGASFPDLWRRGGDYVDKILRGAKPANLPVEQPTKFELVINLMTAKTLGLDVATDAPCARRRGDRIRAPACCNRSQPHWHLAATTNSLLDPPLLKVQRT